MPEVFPAADSYVPPLETMLMETAREYSCQFNLIHRDTGFPEQIPRRSHLG
jgi:hypothetical protein